MSRILPMMPGLPAGRRERSLGLLFLLLYILTIPLGNWVVMNAGLVCPGNGAPCLVPVWPGIWSPSGVLVAGFESAF